MDEHFYRITETTYSAGCDDWGDPIPGGPTRTNLSKYKVLRRTPKGAWIEDLGGLFSDRRFVLLSARKRFAAPTVEEAIESYKARKARQIKILNGQIRRAEEALRYLDTHGFYFDERKWA
jgi:hypothetical protein